MHGLLDEIVFTALFDIIFEPSGNRQLKGYSTIFSFFIYGSCSFVVERLYDHLYLKRRVPQYFRIPIYVCVLYIWEFTCGLILRQFNACSWDYSHYRYNVMGLITFEYAPAWIIMCMWQDVLSNFLLSLSINFTRDDDTKAQEKTS